MDVKIVSQRYTCKKQSQEMEAMIQYECGCVKENTVKVFSFHCFDSTLCSSGNQIAALSQMSWLMKTAAIELRVTSLNRQRSHTQRLVSLLLDDQPHTQHTGISVVKCFHRTHFNLYTLFGLVFFFNIFLYLLV